MWFELGVFLAFLSLAPLLAYHRSVTDAICLTQTLNNPYNRGYPYTGRTGDMLHRLARFHPLDFLAAVATYTN